MALDIFLKMQDIAGESIDAAHRGEIDVIEFGFGMSQSGSLSSMGSGAGKGTIQELSITKFLDRSTPLLMRALMKGTHISEMTLSVRQADSADLHDHYQIILEETMLGSYRMTPEVKDERCMENWSIAFRKMRVVYRPQGDGGAEEAGKVEFKWNVVTNSEA